jgi:putative sigma-54 modulation protein
MRIGIRQTGHWPQETVDLARTRLAFALGRFAGRVRSVSVSLTDLNGPRGGLDKKCLIAVRLEKPSGVVVVEEVDTDEAVAVSRAAERASRAVARAIDSTGDWRALAPSRRP